MMDMLQYKILLADRMIQKNPDVTIGEYWKLINEEKEPVIVGYATPMKSKRYYPPFRYKDEPEEKKPIVRPVAKYDNRSQEDIYNQYS